MRHGVYPGSTRGPCTIRRQRDQTNVPMWLAKCLGHDGHRNLQSCKQWLKTRPPNPHIALWFELAAIWSRTPVLANTVATVDRHEVATDYSTSGHLALQARSRIDPGANWDWSRTDLKPNATDRQRVATEFQRVTTDCQWVAADCQRVGADCQRVATDCQRIVMDCQWVVIDCQAVATDCQRVAADC